MVHRVCQIFMEWITIPAVTIVGRAPTLGLATLPGTENDDFPFFEVWKPSNVWFLASKIVILPTMGMKLIQNTSKRPTHGILTIRKSRGAPDDSDHGNCDPLPGASGGTAGTGIPTPSPIQGVVKGPKAIPWFPIDMKPGTSGSQNLAKASAPGVFGCFLEDLAQWVGECRLFGSETLQKLCYTEVATGTTNSAAKGPDLSACSACSASSADAKNMPPSASHVLHD